MNNKTEFILNSLSTLFGHIVSKEQSLSELEYDSHKISQFIKIIENEYNIILNIERIVNLDQIDKIIDYIHISIITQHFVFY